MRLNVTELKPCPFCGGQAKKNSNNVNGGYGCNYTEFYVSCTSCRARGPSLNDYYGQKDFSMVEDLWNNRV